MQFSLCQYYCNNSRTCFVSKSFQVCCTSVSWERGGGGRISCTDFFFFFLKSWEGFLIDPGEGRKTYSRKSFMRRCSWSGWAYSEFKICCNPHWRGVAEKRDVRSGRRCGEGRGTRPGRGGRERGRLLLKMSSYYFFLNIFFSLSVWSRLSVIFFARSRLVVFE